MVYEIDFFNPIHILRIYQLHQNLITASNAPKLLVNRELVFLPDAHFLQLTSHAGFIVNLESFDAARPLLRNQLKGLQIDNETHKEKSAIMIDTLDSLRSQAG